MLTTQQAKKLLLQLPYKYRFRKVELPEGSSGALAGAAFGDRHHVVLQFGISLGTEVQPLPVPQAGIANPYYYWGAGFAFNSNLVVPGGDNRKTEYGVGRGIHTRAQWREAMDMEFEIEQKLCEASTGKSCPAV